MPAAAQPLFGSSPTRDSLGHGGSEAPPKPAASTQRAEHVPAQRGRSPAAVPDRVQVNMDDVPEYVLFAMITRQIEVRVPEEELRALDPKRQRRKGGAPQPDGASVPTMAPEPADSWGGAEAATETAAWDGTVTERRAGVAADGTGHDGVEASAGGRRRPRATPPPPTAEELAKREEEAVWGWSEAGEGGPGGGAERGRNAALSDRAQAQAAAGNATLADEWSDTFPADVPRTSEDWVASDVGATPVSRHGRRSRMQDADAVRNAAACFFEGVDCHARIDRPPFHLCRWCGDATLLMHVRHAHACLLWRREGSCTCFEWGRLCSSSHGRRGV